MQKECQKPDLKTGNSEGLKRRATDRRNERAIKCRPKKKGKNQQRKEKPEKGEAKTLAWRT